MKVVVCAEIQWRYVRTRKQQILSRLPRHWPILFLQAYVRGRRNDWVPRQDGSVTYVTVPALKNVPNPTLRRILDLGIVRAAVNLVLWIWVRTVMLATGFHGRDVLLFVSNIYFARVLRYLPRRAALYDCNDDHTAFPNTPTWARGYYERLVRQVDTVVVSSHVLREIIEPLRPTSLVEIGNGVDFELFQTAWRTPSRPADIVKLTSPRIGYVGALAEWIDLELLLDTARAFPDGTVVLVGPLVGPQAAAWESFARLPNVAWLGSKPYEAVPHYLAEMDVCLIPFRLGPLTRGVNPNKLHEYLALGKPVVCTDFSPFLEDYKALVRIASTPDEFVRSIRDVLESPGDPEARRRVARQNSWQEAARRMTDLLESLGSTDTRPGQAPGRNAR